VAAYNQQEINGLIGCPKRISDPPKREMRQSGAFLRNDMKLVASDDTEGQFSVFMRKSGDFPENFSIGLIYHPADSRGEITLVRCRRPQ